jgi:hypothetical protein
MAAFVFNELFGKSLSYTQSAEYRTAEQETAE